MAVVPNLEAPGVQQDALPGRGIPRVDDNVPTGAVGPIGAQGVMSAADTLADLASKEKDKQDQLRITDKITQLEAGKTAIRYGTVQPDGSQSGGAYSLQGVNAMNLPAKYLPQYDAMASQLASDLTPEQQKMFAPHVMYGRAEINQDLNRYEFEEGKRTSDTIFKNSVEQSQQNAAVGWRDPAQLAKARAQVTQAIQVQGQHEGWSPEVTAAQQRQGIADMHIAVMQSMVADGDVPAARAYLFSNTQDLSAAQSEAAHRAIHAEEQQEAEKLRQDKADRADNIMKQAIILKQKGRLSVGWIYQNAGDLNQHELESAIMYATGAPSKSDMGTFSKLYGQASQGMDVRDDANAALRRGALTTDDYVKITDKSASGRPGSMKAGVDYIETALKVSDTDPDPAISTSKANALADYDTWASDNPKATAEAATKEARAIVNRYQLVDPEKSILTLPVPRFLIGTRTQPDVGATEQRTREAVLKGDISWDEAAREANLLKKWKAAIDYQKQQQAAAAPPKK